MARVPSILFRRGPARDLDKLTAPDGSGDLHLDLIVGTIVRNYPDDRLEPYFYATLRDVADVNYRQDVFRDLELSQNRSAIDAFVKTMDTVRHHLAFAAKVWHPLQKQGWLVHAVDAYCTALLSFSDAMADMEIRSEGLRQICDYIATYVDDSTFRSLVDHTRTVHTRLSNVRYTVHIEGPRVDVDTYDHQSDYSADVAAVFERFRTETGRDYHVQRKDFPDMNHVEEQILDCVAKLHPDEFSELRDFCSDNSDFIDGTIARFDREVKFYLTYLDYIKRFAAQHLRFSYPVVTAGSGSIYVEDAFDVALADKQRISGDPVVGNDFRLGDGERVLVVTGPNQGGKTTFARTVGQVFHLAALGCPIPATRATLTFPDAIFTHFERRERLSTLRGKLDNELVRIHDILSQATAHSVIVMNESFSSTTVNDASCIGTAVLSRIIELGCVAVYVTFIDELASLDAACVSMVGDVAADDPTQRTFHFTRRPADGLAYAAALADKYGLSRDVLERRITR